MGARVEEGPQLAMLKELEPSVDQLQMVRQSLLEALRGLTPEQLSRKMPDSEWSIKDALAHLAGNETLLTQVLMNIASGSDESEVEFDSDAVNAQQVERAKQLSAEQVIQELAENRNDLLQFLDSLTPEQVERRGSHLYEGMLDVREFLVVLYSHEATHGREIVEWARQLLKQTGQAGTRAG